MAFQRDYGLYINELLADPDSTSDMDVYPFSIPSIRQFLKSGSLKILKPVTIFVGENGSGKSTFVEAIAACAALNLEGGSNNFNFSTKKSESLLAEHMRYSRILRPKDSFFLRAESFYNLATEIDERDLQINYGGGSLHSCSHGESFLALVKHRFWGDGLYILDEPESALSPARLLELLIHIKNLVAKRSQFIIATHSPILMGYPDAQLIEMNGEGFQEVRFEDTEHYRITKYFLNNTDSMLRELGF